MPLIAAEANQMLDTEVTRLVYLSIHTADPGSTGANESTGSGYARQLLVWNPASAGSIQANELTFTPNDAASTTYTHGGYWDSATGGTYLGDFAFSAAKTLADGDSVKVTAKLGETLT